MNVDPKHLVSGDLLTYRNTFGKTFPAKYLGQTFNSMGLRYLFECEGTLIQGGENWVRHNFTIDEHPTHH